MKTAFEAAVHAAVVVPVLLLARTIETAAKSLQLVSRLADRLTGTRRRGGPGFDGVGVA